MPRASLRTYTALCMLFSGACTERVRKPKAPDLSALYAAYRAPGGRFDGQTVGAVLAALDAKISGLTALCGFGSASDLFCDSDEEKCGGCAGLSPLLEAFDALTGGAPEGGIGDAGARLEGALEGEGYVEITRICPGHLTKPAPDPDNGAIELTLGFTERGIDPVVFGGFEACELDILNVHNTIDCAVNMSFGEPFGVGGLGSLAPIVQLVGELRTAVGTQRLETDLQLDLSGNSGLRLLLRVDEVGDVVFAQTGDGPAFVAKNGTFVCGRTSCINERGEEVVLP